MINSEAVKYPRTPHLPFSLGATSDDKFASTAALANLSNGRDLTVTEKYDGGNVTFSRSFFYARSLDSGTHSWDTQAKALWARVRWSIPEGWRISGESLLAARSVRYSDLPDIYLVFGIWDETNTLLDWDTTEEYATLLGLHTVPVLYRGNDFKEASAVWEKTHNEETSEGFVMRSAGRIPFNKFDMNVAKYVRANHVRTSSDWRNRDDWAKNTVRAS